MTRTLQIAGRQIDYFPLDEAASPDELAKLPYVVRVFLENVLRHQGKGASPEHVALLLDRSGTASGEFPFFPARVILQDFTGVPCVADLAALRAAVKRLGGDASQVNPKVPVDLVIDHSVIVDAFGSNSAFARNVELEYERNGERYAFLRWAQGAFDRFSVVPPGAGIVHQVNLEYLARVVQVAEVDGRTVAYPDTLLGTDSHTTMIGGLGVLGWGVGGIEAEAGMLAEPIGMLPPVVVGVRLDGSMPEGVTATDFVLAVTELLRKHGVVGKFVEFYGPGLRSLTVSDRATISNMSPEYGATEGIFPVDEQTLTYLRNTGREDDLVEIVEAYTKAQHLFHTPDDPEPLYNESLVFDLGSLVPSLAGPSRPQDRVALPDIGDRFRGELERFRGGSPGDAVKLRRKQDPEFIHTSVQFNGKAAPLSDGSVVIAAITSCTNTSNPSVMVGAGLLARNAVARGLTVAPTVKTSMAPGSPVVMDYLHNAGLIEPLEALGFNLVGFGCTTCIGNSGPLPEPVAQAIDDKALTCAAVLSGNRNFEGRVHQQVKASFLASPPLVVAFALAGTVDIDLTEQPIGSDRDGNPVYLREIWPSSEEIAQTVAASMDKEAFRTRFGAIFAGDERWHALKVPEGDLYQWDPASTYIAEPPFVADTQAESKPPPDIVGARVLVYVGDSVTTDHISPAGQIQANSPAGAWLAEHGVEAARLHSYGARRGNHEVMVRGTFANIRLKNELAKDESGTIKEGGYTTYLADAGDSGVSPDAKGPTGELTTVFDASEQYRAAGVPLVVFAGREYGTGSSRDWAAKGTFLLGVRAVLAASYERIHRANLVQMGVLPLELPDTPKALGLTGFEVVDIRGLDALEPGQMVDVVLNGPDGGRTIQARARIDTHAEVRYFREGGILPAVVREIARRS
jgi:aconitate hydratase